MATRVGSLLAELGLNTARYEAGLKSSATATQRFQRKAQKQFDQVNRAVVRMAGAFATVTFGALIKNSLDAQASLFDLSKRLGTSADGLSRLQYAAEQSGVSVRTLNMGLQRQVRRISEAANGTGEAVKALDELGLSAARLNQLAPEQQFSVLADAIMRVQNPADRVRLAMKLFDSEGVALVQTMEGGSQALSRFADESDRLGRTISDSAAAQAKAATDAFTRMGSAGTGLAQVLAIQIAPSLTTIANLAGEALPNAFMLGRDGFKMAGAGMIEVVARINEGLGKWAGLLAKLPGQVGEFYSGLAASFESEAARLRDSQAMVFDTIETGRVQMADYAGEVANVAEAYNTLTLAAGESNEANKYTIDQLTGIDMNRLKARNRKIQVEQTSHLDRMAALNFAGNKKLAKVQQSASLAKATMAGYEAVQLAWASAPFPANLAAVALTTAETLANVAAIKSSSFEGGGYTGSGPRSGGVDGKGGFPAILHPNETVIDHTKGGGAAPVVNIYPQALDTTGLDDMLVERRGLIANLVRQALADQGVRLA